MAQENTSEDKAIQTKIEEFMSKHPKGVTNQVLQDMMTQSMTREEYVACLNQLLAQNKIQLLTKGGQLVYKLKDSGSGKQYQDTDLEEKLVFDAVQRSGNNGVASRDLKFQCHLSVPQINKILKNLESKKLVKCVQSTTRKKLFMLYDLEPSQTITGGTFYTGQEFETQFVDVLGDYCYKYLVQAKAVADKLSDPISQKNASFKSLKDICDYINGLNISKVNLSLKDIESILESLIYDDKLEKSVSMSKSYSSKDSGTENLYRVIKPLIKNGGFMMVPCGVCHVYRDCHVGGIISPATCVYMQEWLDF